MGFKKLLKHKNFLAWSIVTILAAGVLTAGSIVASNTSLYTFFNGIFGGPRAITASGTNAGLYVQDYETKEEAYNNGNLVSKKICEEGMVLLKNENNALPLKADAKVSVFGKNSKALVTGGSGSAAPKQDEPVKTIFDSLSAANIAYNPTLKAFYDDDSKSGPGRPENPSMASGGVPTLTTGETPVASYTSDVTGSYSSYKDAALVVFSRIAGENWDLPRHMEEDANHHYLQLDSNERALLKHVCESGFDHVIVLINSSNNIDLGFLKFQDDPAYQEKIDGAILIGSVGAQGIMALGEILNGTVNPSGHTVDTLYTKYENDPTWQNFGDNLEEKGDSYLKPDGKKRLYYFVDYEEDIYYGYRYYETRGHVDGEEWYSKNVVYPFGHGLSYTTFKEELLHKGQLESALKADEPFTVEVQVTNTGDRPGKHVVQLYASAPYTEGGIEKSYKVLVGFGKTKLLNHNDKDTVRIEVNPYDFASYDCYDKNNNNFAGYELEKGDYTFFASTDAHHSFDTFTKNLAADAKFEKDPVTGETVVNRYQDADDHLNVQLSRADFAGTFPEKPTVEERTVTDEWVNSHLKNYTSNNPELESYTQMPITGQVTSQIAETDSEGNVTNREIRLKDLLGKDYKDPMWNDFLNEFTFDELKALFNGGSYSTAAVARLGVPATLSCDGPTGIVAFLGTPEVYGTTYYCSEVLLAQTYNLELATEQGLAIGNECLLGDQRPNGSHMPYTGWYSPGVNIHRSPFGGRNTEYYSEDPFMAGHFAAKVIAAAQSKGVYTTVKHFALNDQETHRSIGGGNYWVSEQAIREIYLKPFEIAVKEGKTLGVMSAFTRIGTVWTGGDYRLLTSILRKEWGFVGLVICDFHTDLYMNNRQMCYAGGDLNLTSVQPWDNADPENIADVTCLRRAAHNLLYVLTNSNAMRADILGYKMPYWQLGLFIGDGVIAAGLALWGFFAIRGALKKGKEEE